MLQKIESYMRKFDMLQEGWHIIVGVSGGADSVCLFRVLSALQEKLKHTISVVHVEHGIRGAESLEDALFVERLCEKYGVECKTVHYRVPEYAKEHGLSEEEAGRKLRYEAFEKECIFWETEKKKEEVRIAVAHNQNDNAETMLFHLARGTGIRGLAGIPPVRGRIIRPLLQTGREQIENYLRGLGQPYCIDFTNQEDNYMRNRIRHRILPEMQQLNDQAICHMEQTALELMDIGQYMEKQTKEAEKTCVAWDGPDGMKRRAVIRREAYEQMDRAIQTRLIYSVMEQLAHGRKDLTRESVLSVKELFERQTGRQIQMGHGLTAQRVYEGVCIFGTEYVEKIEFANGINGELPFTVIFPKEYGTWVQGRFEFELTDADERSIKEISKKKYTKCFDYDKIKDSVCIRNRLPGDYLAVNDVGHKQKLKKYLVNEKIPSLERERLYLLADGSHIIWVVGYRISSHYKVDADTRRILRVTFYGGKEDG